MRCRLVSLHKGSDWRSFAAVCMVCGIGLTVSIFIADLSYASLPGIFLLNSYLPRENK
ncbi:MAG: Na+/H+ antiporter NhaA [Bacteroidaceae bacterium]|nr:Na+/H+ antiporter NhaA [Bacteroidaceae bacterium]